MIKQLKIITLLFAFVNGTIVYAESRDAYKAIDLAKQTSNEALIGSGTESDPYLIGSSIELKKFFDLLDSNNKLCGRLTADITLNENVLDSNYNLNGDGSNFEQWSCREMRGTFNGAGHKISGVYINNNSEYQAFFRGVNHIDSLGIVDSYIKARRHVGGFTSWLGNEENKGGVISNCYFDGVVIATNDKAGGIAAHMGNGYEGGLQNKIINCYNKGKISGDNHVGGICGSAYSLTSTNADYIESCYNIGQISASWTDCGAICGYADNAYGSKVSANASKCYYLNGSCTKMGQGYMGTSFTSAELADGTVCSLLNANGGCFHQTVGTDCYPKLFATQVFEHEYVDLGLPSGTLWATCNIGASSPEEYGYYFGWGEIAPKTKFSESNYRFYDNDGFSKYNTTDGKTILDLEDDAAHVLWGEDWRMPTHAEEIELANNCTWQEVEINGIYGLKVIGRNGNFIFMPKGGLYDPSDFSPNDSTRYAVNDIGWYWSSDLNTIGSSYAQGLYLTSSAIVNVSDHERCDGHNIRPVINGPHFTKQPTADDLSVEVSKTDGAIYQWYCNPTSGVSTYDDWTSTNAGQVSSSSSNTYEIDGSAGQELTFDWSVSSEANYDKLTVTINGETKIQESGVKNGSYSYAFDRDEKLTIVATYSKDSSQDGNSDQASITNICVCAPASAINGANTNTLGSEKITETGYYYCQVTYSNSGIVLKSDKVFRNVEPGINVTDITGLTYAVYASNDITGKKNSQITVPISLKNSNAITLWQADLQLPAGFTIASDAYGDPLISLAGSRTTASRHSIATSTLADGKTRLLCSSSTNKTFSGTDGQVASITLNVANSVTDGEYPLVLSNILMVEADETKHSVEPVTSKVTIKNYTLGDVNDDGNIDGADLVGIVNYILQTPKAGNVEEAADVNQDGVIDGGDYVREVNVILGTATLSAKSANKAKTNILTATGVPYSVYTDDATCKAGEQVTLSVKMDNENPVTLWQCDLVLPEGVTIATDEFDDLMVSITGRTTLARHSLATNTLSDGSIRLLCSSTTNKNFSGTSGEVAQITLNVPNGIAVGDYSVMIKNILLVEANETKHSLESTKSILSVNGSTAIKSIASDKSESAPVYNISGQRINSNSNIHGIYIKNGKKIVKK